MIVGHHCERDSAGLSDDASGFDRVAPGGGAAGAPPARPLTLAGQDNGYPLRLSRQQRGDGGQLILCGATLDHRTWWMRMPVAWLWTVDQPHLEKREVFGAATDIASQSGEKPGKQRRA
jgi:hypothetical protein